MSGISQFSLPKPLPPHQPHLQPLILIADDDNNMRVQFREAMEKLEYRVVAVADGQQCLDVYKDVNPDLVLLDAVMPVIDGFTCCERIRQISRDNLRSVSVVQFFDTDFALEGSLNSILWKWKSTPIVMITSLKDEESINQAFKSGATDYITKPISWALLRHKLEQLLQQAKLYKHLEKTTQTLQQLAYVDALTELANRRQFDYYLNTQWLKLEQEQLPLSLILCDIDFFKYYNDQYGHPAGDICLKKVGDVLNSKIKKKHDLVARYGGEEFAVIMPNTKSSRAVNIAATMQAGVRDLQIVHPRSGVSEYVTLSMGIGTTIPTGNISPIDLVVAADKALYQAKALGRNRIIVN
jgi:diguanylate cyclase (GGDEF)-like protein